VHRLGFRSAIPGDGCRKVVGKECGIHYWNPGGNSGSPIPGWWVQDRGGDTVWNGMEECQSRWRGWRSAERGGIDCWMKLKTFNVGWGVPTRIEESRQTLLSIDKNWVASTNIDTHQRESSSFAGRGGGGGGGGTMWPSNVWLKMQWLPEYNLSHEIGQMYLDIHLENTLPRNSFRCNIQAAQNQYLWLPMLKSVEQEVRHTRLL